MGRQPQTTVLAISALRETVPVGGPADQLRYLNGAMLVTTSLGPHELLAALQQIETRLGRRRGDRWGPRTLDLDLLLYGDLVLETPSLVLPHPRMAWRRFVLEPAAEVAGTMMHPTTGWTVARLLEHLNTTPRYVAITGPIAAGKTHLAERLAAAISGQLVVEQPHWQRLEEFYSDPAANGPQTEWEFLHQRAELLAAGRPQWSGSAWTISDFWFDQSAAFARAWLNNAELPRLLQEYERLRGEVVRPRVGRPPGVAGGRIVVAGSQPWAVLRAAAKRGTTRQDTRGRAKRIR